MSQRATARSDRSSTVGRAGARARWPSKHCRPVPTCWSAKHARITRSATISDVSKLPVGCVSTLARSTGFAAVTDEHDNGPPFWSAAIHCRFAVDVTQPEDATAYRDILPTSHAEPTKGHRFPRWPVLLAQRERRTSGKAGMNHRTPKWLVSKHLRPGAIPSTSPRFGVRQFIAALQQTERSRRTRPRIATFS